METLYFLVVSFVMANPQALDRPLYVYYKPNFETYDQCYTYANKNNQMIYGRAAKNNQMIYGRAAHHYDYKLRPESIYCITGEQVKEMHNNTWEEKKAL